MDSLRAWSPPPALGTPPEVVTEPFTAMLWGITTEAVRRWAGGGDAGGGGLTGFAASPGVAEGPARVVLSATGIGELRDGEVLVARLTAPSWAPVFGKIVATVTDVGGIMSHAAIVCREYGLPAVTGTAFGTEIIKTGQLIRVDGNTGTVTVLHGTSPDQ
jgi:pyruvate,water dikinase